MLKVVCHALPSNVRPPVASNVETEYKAGDGASILVVEDDANDVLFLRRAIKKAGVQLTVIECKNGTQAISFLTRQGDFADEFKFPWPQMLITDLKMPQMGGMELLRWLQDNPTFRVFPTIVLSSAKQPKEVAQAYALGVAAYLTKPSSYEEFDRLVACLLAFWKYSVRPDNFPPS